MYLLLIYLKYLLRNMFIITINNDNNNNEYY